LPSPVGLRLWLHDSAPLLQPHYRPSSLLRANPPLARASVLGALWVCHLAFSLRITGEVPTFRARTCCSFTPPLSRTPSGSVGRCLPDSSRANDSVPVSTSSIRFRPFISGSI